MFTPQFGLYDQVKQSQLEMERSAQLDLEIWIAGAEASNLPTQLRGLMANWGSQLQHRLAGGLSSFVVMVLIHHKTV